MATNVDIQEQKTSIMCDLSNTALNTVFNPSIKSIITIGGKVDQITECTTSYQEVMGSIPSLTVSPLLVG